jgi:hypothetical protein
MPIGSPTEAKNWPVVLLVGAAALVNLVLPTKHDRLAADERPDPGERLGPERCVNGRIVDVADQRRELFAVSHGIFP